MPEKSIGNFEPLHFCQLSDGKWLPTDIDGKMWIFEIWISSRKHGFESCLGTKTARICHYPIKDPRTSSWPLGGHPWWESLGREETEREKARDQNSVEKPELSLLPKLPSLVETENREFFWKSGIRSWSMKILQSLLYGLALAGPQQDDTEEMCGGVS